MSRLPGQTAHLCIDVHSEIGEVLAAYANPRRRWHGDNVLLVHRVLRGLPLHLVTRIKRLLDMRWTFMDRHGAEWDFMARDCKGGRLLLQSGMCSAEVMRIGLWQGALQ